MPTRLKVTVLLPFIKAQDAIQEELLSLRFTANTVERLVHHAENSA